MKNLQRVIALFGILVALVGATYFTREAVHEYGNPFVPDLWKIPAMYACGMVVLLAGNLYMLGVGRDIE